MKLLKVIGTKIAVKATAAPDRTSSGLYIPAVGTGGGVIQGLVVCIDEHGELMDGRKVGGVIKVGDHVVFKEDSSYQGSIKLDLEDGEVYITDINNLLGVIN